MEKQTITIEIPAGKKAEWVNGVLTLVDEQPVEFKFKVGDKVTISPCGFIGLIKGRYNESGVAAYKVYSELEGDFEAPETSLEPYTEPQDITERIKTFEDAMEWCTLNGKNNLVHEYDCIHTDSLIIDEPTADLIAYLKMRIITAALNEGWEPQFTDGEWRYFPWFGIITKEEWDEMDDEDKARCVGRANNNANAHGGLVFAVAGGASSVSSTYCGSRLAFKSEELAVYAGKQFIDIYKDFVTL